MYQLNSMCPKNSQQHKTSSILLAVQNLFDSMKNVLKKQIFIQTSLKISPKEVFFKPKEKYSFYPISKNSIMIDETNFQQGQENLIKNVLSFLDLAEI